MLMIFICSNLSSSSSSSILSLLLSTLSFCESYIILREYQPHYCYPRRTRILPFPTTTVTPKTVSSARDITGRGGCHQYRSTLNKHHHSGRRRHHHLRLLSYELFSTGRSIPDHDDDSNKNNNNNDDNTGSDSDDWTLEQDWALLDSVGDYTIQTDTETRTFWSQLWSSTPILFTTKQSPDDLYHRMVQLQSQQQHHHQQNFEPENDAKTSQKNTTTTSSTRSHDIRPNVPVFGPSPPILHNWFLSTETISASTQSNNNNRHNRMMMGQTDDGRTIWFHYHVIGRLKDDPFVAVSAQDNISLFSGSSSYEIFNRQQQQQEEEDLVKNAAAAVPSTTITIGPGGYVEAFGGRIYELGVPQQQQQEQQNQYSSVSSSLSHTDVQQSVDNSDIVGSSSSSSNGKKQWDGWITTGTATLSAVLATTVLSLSIGYCAGLSLIQDNAMRQQQSQPVMSSAVQTVKKQTMDNDKMTIIPASSAIVRIYSSDSSSSSSWSSSMRGQDGTSPTSSSSSTRSSMMVIRASSTAKGTTEKTAGTMTTKTATVTSPSQQQQPIRIQPSQEELRAKAQYRVLREERLLQQLSQRLEQDKQMLEDLGGGGRVLQ